MSIYYGILKPNIERTGGHGNYIHGAELPSLTKIIWRQGTTSTSLHFNLLRP